MIRALLVDRTPHLRMNGVARYMMGVTSHPDPSAVGVDLRVLYWGREVPSAQWRIHSSPAQKPSALATQVNRRILRPLAQRRSPSDVIHYPFHYLPDDWTAGRGAKVVTVHGASAFAQELWEPARGERIRRSLQLGLEQLARIITVSEWSKQELVEQFALPAEKITVIPNGVRQELFQPLAQKKDRCSRLATAFGIHAPYLLHVGPCEPRKNLLNLVRAFAALKGQADIPHVLVLAGARGRLTEAVQQEVARLNIAKWVIATGVVDDAVLVDLYAGAALFVFPSLYEGFGIPVLEAMACGVPVVTSRCSALPEVVDDAAVLIDDPTSSDEIAHCCEQVLRDNPLRTALRTRGFVRAQQFSWQACALAHLQLYKEVG